MSEPEFKCTHVASCDLYGQFRMVGTLRIWQIRYCHHERRHAECERFQASKRGESVPATLLPNGDHLAAGK